MSLTWHRHLSWLCRHSRDLRLEGRYKTIRQLHLSFRCLEWVQWALQEKSKAADSAPLRFTKRSDTLRYLHCHHPNWCRYRTCQEELQCFLHLAAQKLSVRCYWTREKIMLRQECPLRYSPRHLYPDLWLQAEHMTMKLAHSSWQ